ncbi:hypothetical protein J45TS6_12870 [Paenibacillus sp. J45TS6]|uniref:hypothetical protein n=1 Tax=unclassified Paenibacillus TaxID=185978 RepID=UPI001AFF8406|nr:hypothetical protein [Paenibacillus sp. J45TS6]GIP42828.1 hypothetical protein J45TS6_12870 [Paenibacillus sp. J45TS6]
MTTVAVIDTCVIQNFCNINRFDLFGKLKYFLFTTIYVDLEISNADTATKLKYESLISKETIKKVNLTIQDLVQMSQIPESKKYSDAELSCIVKAKQLNSSALTDDKRAINFIRNYIDGVLIKGTKEILVEGYVQDYLNDNDLKELQDKLKGYKFHIKENLVFEAAALKMLGISN